jgi:hypothetical protein
MALTVQNGSLVVRDGAIGTEQACCCNVNAPCTCNTIDCGPLYATVGGITSTSSATICLVARSFTISGTSYFESSGRSFGVGSLTCIVRDGKIVLRVTVAVDAVSRIRRSPRVPTVTGLDCFSNCGTKYEYELELCDENAPQAPRCSTAFSLVRTFHGIVIGDSQRPCDNPPECICQETLQPYVPVDDEGCKEDCWEDETPSFVGFNPLP